MHQIDLLRRVVAPPTFTAPLLDPAWQFAMLQWLLAQGCEVRLTGHGALACHRGTFSETTGTNCIPQLVLAVAQKQAARAA
jgi:hypothetical protein